MDKAKLAAFEQGVLEFIADRREAMGVEDGGLLAYYSQRVEKRRALTRYERELLDLLEGDPWIVHAGIGIGPLTAALALQGSRMLGFELDQRRYAAAVALKRKLAPDADYEIRSEPFPDGLRPDDETATATLLFTNVAGSWPDELYDSAIAAIHHFRRAILDLRLFGHTRNDEAERASLAARLEQAGLCVEPLPVHAANAFYVEVRPAPTEGQS